MILFIFAIAMAAGAVALIGAAGFIMGVLAVVGYIARKLTEG